MRLSSLFLLLLLFLLAWLPSSVVGQEFSGSSLKVIDPVLAPAGFSTSSGYQLFGSIGELALGTSTASSFGLNPGFLFYPFVTTPAVSATAGDTQVALSWTSASSYLGWTVGGYSVGQSTTLGGPYSYSSLGNTTSSTRTGLTNSTPYYFVIRVEDSFSNGIATSTEVTSTPVAASGGGGGGGGGGSSNSDARVVFTGRAYPLSQVTLLKDGQVAVTSVAGPDARFSITLRDLSAGVYTFSLYSSDSAGRRSSLFTVTQTLSAGATTEIGGILLAPTIAVDKQEVKRGENLAIFGQSVASSTVTIAVNSAHEIFEQTPADAQGVYLYNLDSARLEMGGHATKAKTTVVNEISPFGQSVGFKVGTKTVLAGGPVTCPLKGDLNDDCSVNLIDFSIAAFWYQRPLTAAFLPRDKEKLSGDGKVDLVDFSIMAFYWTG